MIDTIIVGMSAAGVSAYQTITRLFPQKKVVAFSAEPYAPYNRCSLASHLSKTTDPLKNILLPSGVPSTVRMGVRVVAVDAAQHYVTTDKGEQLPYRTLLLATGARPVVPAFAHLHLDAQKGVYTYYTMQDVYAMHHVIAARQVTHVVVVGGGFSGLECADALATLGMKVTIVEHQKSLFAGTPPHFGARVQSVVHALGVTCLTGVAVEQMLFDVQGFVQGIVTACGQYVAAQLVVVTCGVQRNSELARLAGVTLHGDAVVVDEYMQTSNSAIYAAGDLVIPHAHLHAPVHHLLWARAALQGVIAGQAMNGVHRLYAPARHRVQIVLGEQVVVYAPMKKMDTGSVVYEIACDTHEMYGLIGYQNGARVCALACGNAVRVVSWLSDVEEIYSLQTNRTMRSVDYEHTT